MAPCRPRSRTGRDPTQAGSIRPAGTTSWPRATLPTRKPARRWRSSAGPTGIPSTPSPGGRGAPPSRPRTSPRASSPTGWPAASSGPLTPRGVGSGPSCWPRSRTTSANQRAREKRVKRGGRVAIVSLDGGGAEARYLREPAHVETAERLYDRRWALTVLDRALDRLERRMTGQGKGPLFDRLKPALLGAEDAVGYAQVAEELGMTEGAVKVAAHRMRARLGALIREEVARTVADPSQIDDEIRDLFSALGS